MNFRTILYAILISLIFFKAYAADYSSDERFFSYKRFILNTKIFKKLSVNDRTRHEVSIFAEKFSNGLDAVFEGRMDVAKESLLEARKAWPEYFNTDFVLALIYEDSGDFKKAARYYKSYLNKLKKFHSGEYRISGPLIRSLTPGDIVEYEEARMLVEKHLDRHGIRLDRVRPVITPPTFLFPILLGVFIGIVYVATIYGLVPYLRKMHRVKNPPEGFWVCKKCGTTNTELSKVCENCGRPYEQ